MQIIFFVIPVIFILLIIRAYFKKKDPIPVLSISTIRETLQKQVSFYQKLSAEEKLRFENKLQRFLQKVRITGIQTVVEDADKVFVAAGAIIPIFAFKDWEYRNIHEVLIYPGSFDEDYKLNGKGRDVLGMVGNGPMQYVMILSQEELRNGFINNSDTSNTAIHEFVHLVDKSDGDTDGVPDLLLTHAYAVPWLKRIHEEMQEIRKGKSDINPYGATNESEFLAVASEYFFEQPEMLEQKHPELYQLLMEAFQHKDA